MHVQTLSFGCISALAILALAACTGKRPHEEPEQKAIGMANPASVYCEKIGGKSVNEKDRDGAERGICHLPDGTRIDELELYRRDNPQA